MQIKTSLYILFYLWQIVHLSRFNLKTNKEFPSREVNNLPKINQNNLMPYNLEKYSIILQILRGL